MESENLPPAQGLLENAEFRKSTVEEYLTSLEESLYRRILQETTSSCCQQRFTRHKNASQHFSATPSYTETNFKTTSGVPNIVAVKETAGAEPVTSWEHRELHNGVEEHYATSNEMDLAPTGCCDVTSSPNAGVPDAAEQMESTDMPGVARTGPTQPMQTKGVRVICGSNDAVSTSAHLKENQWPSEVTSTIHLKKMAFSNTGDMSTFAKKNKPVLPFMPPPPRAHSNPRPSNNNYPNLVFTKEFDAETMDSLEKQASRLMFVLCQVHWDDEPSVSALSVLLPEIRTGIIVTEQTPSNSFSIVFVSSAFSCYTGYTLDELKKKGIQSLYRTQTDQPFQEELQTTFLSGSIYKGAILTNRNHKDPLPSLLIMAPIRYPDGTPQYYVFFVRFNE